MFHLHHLSTSQSPSSHLARLDTIQGTYVMLSGSVPLAKSDCPFPHCSLLFPSRGCTLAMSQGTTISISDGSYMPSQFPSLVAAAWILTDPIRLSSSACSGVIQANGSPHIINSYWVELQGIHILLQAVHWLCEQHELKLGKLLLGCDN